MSQRLTGPLSPHVTSFPRMAVRGWYGEPEQLAVLPRYEPHAFFERWNKPFAGDEMFVQYALPDRSPLPRLNRSALARIAGMDEADMPRLEVLLVDLDYPNHATPPDGWHEGILAKLPRSMHDVAGWYRTAHGMRLVFLPPEPVPLVYAHDVLYRFHETLASVGIETDTATRDWSRLFRAPRALNRDLPRDMSRLAPLGWSDFPAKATWRLEEPGTAMAVGQITTAGRPTDQDAMDKKPKAAIHAVTKDKALVQALATGTLTASEGERHAFVLSTAIKLVEGAPTPDPKVPYELIAPSIDSLNAGASRRMELNELWRICEWATAQVVAKREHRAKLARESLSELGRRNGSTPSEARRAVILDSGKQFYVWDEFAQDYSHGYTAARQLLPALFRHCPSLLDEGVDVSTALMYYSSPVRNVVYSYMSEYAHYDTAKGILTLPAAVRDPMLTPREHKDVAGWLRAMCKTTTDHDHLLDWLAICPDLTRPICALYLDGPPGIGKGLLAAGLARLWNVPAPTPYKALVRQFNISLIHCPLVWADESVPKDAFAEDDAGIFRRVIGNSSHDIEAKYVDAMQLRGYLRVLITANNSEVFQIRETLNNADLDAVRQRLGYIKIADSPEDSDEPSPAVKYLNTLARRDGKESVRDVTQRWVDEGCIAEHMLWLNETRSVRAGSRFAVEGWESELTDMLSVSHGASGVVSDVVARAILLYSQAPHAGGSVRFFGGKVYVNADRLPIEWEDILGHPHEKPPKTVALRQALKALSHGKQERLDWEKQRLRYYVIGSDLIARLGERNNVAEAHELRALCAREEEPTQDAKFSAPTNMRRTP